VIRDMSWRLPKLVPRSAPVILLVLTLAAATGFAAVSHLVCRYNANQQSRGRKLYAQGLSAANAAHYDEAIAAFRAALTCDPTNSQYQLSLARALRDSNDPRRLDEAESYLMALWQRAPQDAAVNLALARVSAHRGSIEDATRTITMPCTGSGTPIPTPTRNKARIELIQFLLKKTLPATLNRNSWPSRRPNRPIPPAVSRLRNSSCKLRIMLARLPSIGKSCASIPRIRRPSKARARRHIVWKLRHRPTLFTGRR